MTNRVIADQLQLRLDDTRNRLHAHCIACGSMGGQQPRLRFVPDLKGGVAADFCPSCSYEGYSGMVHGGVTATMLDAAMTNCLFGQNRCGVTAELHVRYRHPVVTGRRCVIRARLVRSFGPLCVLCAEIIQDDRVCATAEGKFIESANRGKDLIARERNVNVQGRIDQGIE